MTDIRIENHSTLFLFCPLTDAGKSWLSENTNAPDYLWHGNSLVVEHRFAADLANGAIADGLEIE